MSCVISREGSPPVGLVPEESCVILLRNLHTGAFDEFKILATHTGVELMGAFPQKEVFLKDLQRWGGRLSFI